MKRELPEEGIESAVRRLHAGFRTPIATLTSIVREATGQDTDTNSLVKIVRGYDSEVYRASTITGLSVIVRIKRDGDISYAQEAWALEQARNAGVPVPEVLLLSERQINRQRREVMVQRCLPGRAVSDLLPSLTEKQKERIFYQSGEALRQLHTVAVAGFDQRHDDGSFDFPDWDSAMHSAYQHRAEQMPLLQKAEMTEAEIQQGFSVFERYAVQFPCPQPVLLHADYDTGHVFADEDGNLTGVLDFGDFSGGAPETDISYWNINDPEISLAPFLQGYGLRPEWPDWETFYQRLRHCQIMILLDDLTFAAEMDNQEDIKHLLRLYREIMNAIAMD